MSEVPSSPRSLPLRLLYLRAVSDRSLLAYLERRDPAAFAEMCRRHGSYVHAFCASRLGQGRVAELAANETFVRALKVDATSVTDSRLWLRGIAEGVCAEAGPVTAKDGIPAADPDGVDALGPRTDGQQECDVTIALARMSPTSRTALILRDLHGAESEDLAVAMGTTPSAAEKTVASAQKNFCRLYPEIRVLPASCSHAFPLMYGHSESTESEREWLDAHVSSCQRCQPELRWVAERRQLFAAALPLLAALRDRVEPERLAGLTAALGALRGASPRARVPVMQRFAARAAVALGFAGLSVLAAATVMAAGVAGPEEPPARGEPAAHQGVDEGSATDTRDAAPPPSAVRRPRTHSDSAAPKASAKAQNLGYDDYQSAAAHSGAAHMTAEEHRGDSQEARPSSRTRRPSSGSIARPDNDEDWDGDGDEAEPGDDDGDWPPGDDASPGDGGSGEGPDVDNGGPDDGRDEGDGSRGDDDGGSGDRDYGDNRESDD